MQNHLIMFEDRGIRRAYDEDTGIWYFSVVDIVGVLTGSENPRRYWSDLKSKLAQEGSEVYDKIVRLKMRQTWTWRQWACLR